MLERFGHSNSSIMGRIDNINFAFDTGCEYVDIPFQSTAHGVHTAEMPLFATRDPATQDSAKLVLVKKRDDDPQIDSGRWALPNSTLVTFDENQRSNLADGSHFTVRVGEQEAHLVLTDNTKRPLQLDPQNPGTLRVEISDDEPGSPVVLPDGTRISAKYTEGQDQGESFSMAISLPPAAMPEKLRMAPGTLTLEADRNGHTVAFQSLTRLEPGTPNSRWVGAQVRFPDPLPPETMVELEIIHDALEHQAAKSRESNDALTVAIQNEVDGEIRHRQLEIEEARANQEALIYRAAMLLGHPLRDGSVDSPAQVTTQLNHLFPADNLLR